MGWENAFPEHNPPFIPPVCSIIGKCWLVIIHKWTTMYIYFSTTQHNYYNIEIYETALY
jgi:hypothetical protein